MVKRDYYEVSGVSKNASEDEIKKAYRKLAIKYHLDRSPDNPEAEARFEEAAKAYDVLHDLQKRQQYGQFGFDAPGGGFGGGNPFGGADGFSMGGISPMSGDVFGGRGGGFGGFGGGGHQAPKYRGTDLRLEVRLSLQEVATGVAKKFKVRKDVLCEHCHGSGAEEGNGTETRQDCHDSGVEICTQRNILGMMQTQTTCHVYNGEGTITKNRCTHCHGEGVVKGEEAIEINVPAGVAEGMVVNVPGKGNVGRHNGVAGSIQIYIEEESNGTFVRDGQNIIYNLSLDFPTAALGGQADTPTIDGSNVKIKIEPGTQPGKTLHLRGKDLPAVQGYGSGIGDLVVHIGIYVPKELNKEEKRIIEDLCQSESFRDDNSTKRSISENFKKLFC